MSTDMFPDGAVEYLVLHAECPPDHSYCVVEQAEATASGTSSHDDITKGYDSGNQ